MNKLSELISKPVISIYDGQNEGTVGNILFDRKRKKALFAVIFDNSEESPERVLPLQKIYSIGDSIMIRNSGNLELMSNLDLSLSNLYNPVMTTAYDTSGKKYGQINDIIIDDNYNISEFIFSDGVKCNCKKIANFNDSVCILYKENDTIKLWALKQRVKIPKDHNQSIVQIMNSEDMQTQEKSPILPNRAVANYKLLLDRKVTKNISSLNGKVIIRKDTKISNTIIDLAKRYGVLRELTQFSM